MTAEALITLATSAAPADIGAKATVVDQGTDGMSSDTKLLESMPTDPHGGGPWVMW